MRFARVRPPWLEPDFSASQGKAALGNRAEEYFPGKGVPGRWRFHEVCQGRGSLGDGGSMRFPREGRPWEMVVSWGLPGKGLPGKWRIHEVPREGRPWEMAVSWGLPGKGLPGRWRIHEVYQGRGSLGDGGMMRLPGWLHPIPLREGQPTSPHPNPAGPGRSGSCPSWAG